LKKRRQQSTHLEREDIVQEEYRLWSFSCIAVWPRPVTTGPRDRSIAPPPTGLQRRMESKGQKLVGQDKGSLTEHQMKRTVTIVIKRIYKTNSKMHSAALTTQVPYVFLSRNSLPASQLPHRNPS